MTEPKYPDVHVELFGKDGNAFAIIGSTRRSLRDAGVTKDEIGAFTEEAQSGDYDQLLQTVMRWVSTS